MRGLYLLLSFSLLSSCAYLSGPRPEKDYFTMAWAKNTDPTYETGNLPVALNSPFIYEGILYNGDNSGAMVAYELENGRRIWREYDGSSYHASPMIYEDQIIYGTIQGRLFSRHYLTGELKYNVDLGASIETAGAVYKGRIFFQTRSHKIFCLDVTTGKILWAYKRSVPYLTTLQRASRPLVAAGKIYVGFADGFVAAFNVEDGNLLWEQKLSERSKFVDVDMTPFLHEDKLFIGSQAGKLHVLDPRTGQILQALDSVVTRSPQLYNNNILVGTDDGKVVLYSPNLQRLLERKVSKAAISSIVPWKGKLAVSTVAGEIFMVDPSLDGTPLAKYILGHANSAVFGSMQSSEGKLAVFSSRNRLYVFR